MAGTACVLSHFNHVRLFVTQWTVAHRASLSMASSGTNTGVSCHVLLQGIFPTKIKPAFLMSSVLVGGFLTTSATWERQCLIFWTLTPQDLKVGSTPVQRVAKNKTEKLVVIDRALEIDEFQRTETEKA